ncbi:MAG: hypothetical protein PUE85_10035 [Firmicutes bacterium]|nr:hypothetical protein [Bacillota bacterium]
MSEEKVSFGVYFIHLMFFLYFAVLFAERTQSLVRTFTDSSKKPFGNGFDIYVNGLSVFSLCATVIYLFATNRAFFASLFTRSAQVHNAVSMGALCVAAGILLLSGMVHTEYTIAPLQFGAYGALIVAMIIRTAMVQSEADSKLLLWFSLIYLTAFSMAIPVMYRSGITRAPLFHALEAVTALLLVGAFTWMLYLVFTGCAVNLFYLVPMLTAAVLDAILLAMRWNEQVNSFVLIFVIVAGVLFAVGKVLSVCLR